MSCPPLCQIVGSRVAEHVEITVLSNLVHAQAGYLARPATEAPETQIYFINHRSGAFPVLRLTCHRPPENGQVGRL